VPSPTLIRPGPGETLIPVLNPGPGAPYSGAGAPYSGACARRGRGSRLYSQIIVGLGRLYFDPKPDSPSDTADYNSGTPKAQRPSPTKIGRPSRRPLKPGPTGGESGSAACRSLRLSAKKAGLNGRNSCSELELKLEGKALSAPWSESQMRRSLSMAAPLTRVVLVY
jgi:hypothetical protein